MKRGFMIKLTLMMVSLCVAAWRMPDIIEKVTASEGGAGNPMAMLSALTGAAGAEPAPEPEKDIAQTMVVFSATGKTLTNAEKRELIEEALRNAPHLQVTAAKRRGGKVEAVRQADKADKAAAAEAVNLDDPAAFMRALQGGSPSELQAMLDALTKAGN